MAPPFRIFLSAVSSEFATVRGLAASDLRAQSSIDVDFQDDLSQLPYVETTLQMLRDRIAKCDAVVAMLGRRSGALPPFAAVDPFRNMLPTGMDTASYTQWEIILARAQGKDVYFFVADEGWVPDAPGSPEERLDLQLALRNHLFDGHLGLNRKEGIRNAGEMRAEVLRALWNTTHQTAWREFGTWLRLEPDRGRSPPPDEAALYQQRQAALGRQANWRLLQEGCYFRRQDILAGASEGCTKWRHDARSSFARLPVFWIDGRSGDGKSVLLLQLAEVILHDDPRFRIFRLTQAENLPRALEQLANSPKPLLILVDDLHRLGEEEVAGGQLTRMLEGGLPDVQILACGPTPERLEFQKRWSDHFAIQAWTIPGLKQTEREAFADWLGFPGISRDDQTTLLVEFLFVLRVGEPLTTFAKNFRRRMEARHAFQTVRDIVAINALGMPADLSLIDADQVGGFLKVLSREDQRHFSFEGVRLPSSAPGVAFEHPRIAWALFRNWTWDPGDADSIERPLAEALSRMVLAVQARRQDTLAIMSRFVDWHVALSKAQDWPKEELIAVPNREAILRGSLASIPMNTDAKGLLVARLMQDSTIGISKITDDILELAMKIAENDVISDYIRCEIAKYLIIVHFTNIIIDKKMIVNFAYRILLEQKNSACAGFYLLWIELNYNKHIPENRNWMFEFLRIFPQSISAGPLITYLIRSKNEKIVSINIFAAALNWLSESEEKAPAVARGVLEALISALDRIPQQKRSTVVDRALAWLGNEGGEAPNGAQNVLEALISALDRIPQQKRPTVVDRALAWLGSEGGAAPNGAQNVHGALISALDRIPQHKRPTVVDRALAWLGNGGGEAPNGAQNVLGALIRAC